MVVPSQLALKTHTNFGYAANLATLDKLVNRFLLLPVPPPFGDTSLTHVRHIQVPTSMAQSFIINLCPVLLCMEYLTENLCSWRKVILPLLLIKILLVMFLYITKITYIIYAF
jgi:hypothetical protein